MSRQLLHQAGLPGRTAGDLLPPPRLERERIQSAQPNCADRKSPGKEEDPTLLNTNRRGSEEKGIQTIFNEFRKNSLYESIKVKKNIYITFFFLLFFAVWP